MILRTNGFTTNELESLGCRHGVHFFKDDASMDLTIHAMRCDAKAWAHPLYCMINIKSSPIPFHTEYNIV